MTLTVEEKLNEAPVIALVSETTLLSALHAVQGSLPTLVRDSTNPQFDSRYLSLGGLMDAVLPVLNANGLLWITKPEQSHDGSPVLIYSLIHVASAASIDGTMPLLLDKKTAQGVGSALTYARRYALMAVLGLVADDDDDGNAASTPAGHADDRRPSIPPIPLDRARALLELAVTAELASMGGEGTEFKVELKPVLKAKLATLGVTTGKLGDLNVDQAEDVEKWLKTEAES